MAGVGKNNRSRRAAKAKQHRSGHRFTRRERDGSDAFGLTDRQLAAGLFDLAARCVSSEKDDTAAVAVGRLGRLPAHVVDVEIERMLRSTLVVLWDNGWQPHEVVRQVRRAGSSTAGRLTAVVVVADHAHRHADTLDPQWAAQVAALRAGVPAAPGGPAGRWFAGWCEQEALGRDASLMAAVTVLACLCGVGPIAELVAPPGRGRRAGGSAAGVRVDAPVLARVRALLAQAESTTFPAEAEAFTAKAHELMTRYAIDQALLAAENRDEQPTSRRIAIDDPYVDAKSYLLQVVAEHNRCRAVFDGRYAHSTVVGFGPDLDAAELLFTSLLVQAHVALTSEARNAPAGARTRGRSFRSSFLVAYAARIGERLAEINRVVLDTVEAETQRSALPVLAARRSEVDDAIDRLFGHTLQHSPVKTTWDGFGAMRGKIAGDQAQLALADLAEANVS